MEKDKALKVLMVASEMAPFAKSGGLGDVIGSLPKALAEMGVDVRVVLPKYKTIKTEHFADIRYLGDFPVSLSWRNQKAGVLEKKMGNVTVYFLENDYYFWRDGYYGYDDDNERFAFFSKAVLDMLRFLDFYPDIVHCNDWQTGPICMLLKETFYKFIDYQKIKTIYTIHNLQYQGRFSRETMELFDLSFDKFYQCEYYGQVNFMKAGLVYADQITTVSPTYAEEVQTFQYGYGLDGVLRERKDNLCGILNGIDYQANDPSTDKRLFVPYSADQLEQKKEYIHALQEQLGLPQSDCPMLTIISRLADQKGLDLISWALERLVNEDIQLVVLGTGERRYEDYFRGLEWNHKNKVSANIIFDDTLAQRIYAAGDLFLMPSLFEPCGLGQLFALRYGNVPVVRKTGGLSDTVCHFDPQTGSGNGFVFEHYTGDGLLWAIRQALDYYWNDKNNWNKIVRNAMGCNFAWTDSAKAYLRLYERMLTA